MLMDQSLQYNFSSSNVEVIVVDEIVFRLSIASSVPEIFAIEV